MNGGKPPNPLHAVHAVHAPYAYFVIETFLIQEINFMKNKIERYNYEVQASLV
jgi:hypothetical protein